MYITHGSFKSLLKWFEEKGPRFLCLLVAGGFDDAELFEKVFDRKEALDVISGEDIGIFLFASGKENLIGVKVDVSKALALPGRMILQDADEDIIPVPISKVNANSRDNVVRASQTIAHDIAKHYGLRVDDIPCILLLSKGEHKPLIIPTKDQADVKLFYKFLKSLAKLAERLPDTMNLERTWENVPTKEKHKETQKMLKDCVRIQSEIEQLAKKYKGIFHRRTLYRPVLSFIISFVGVAQKTKEVLSVREAIEKAIAGSATKGNENL